MFYVINSTQNFVYKTLGHIMSITKKIFRVDLLSYIESVMIYAFSLFVASQKSKVNIFKLTLTSALICLMFLYCSGYVLPGGGIHYSDWALAIANQTTLPLSHAQREVSMALAYLLTGFTINGSYFGITLLYAIFSILIPLIAYWVLQFASKKIGFYVSLLLIFSLSPFTYIKFFYPDQIYMTFNLAMVGLIIAFIWTRDVKFLYWFTLFAFLVTLTRTSATLIFPVMFVTAWFFLKFRFKHLVICISLFCSGLVLYKAHRFEVFDLGADHETKPVGKGYQILYATYLWMGDFGYELKPELGPNTALLLEHVRANLEPSPAESPLVLKNFGQSPEEFMQTNFYNYSIDELVQKMASEPNEEFYFNLIYPLRKNGGYKGGGSLGDDEWQLEIAKEIWIGYPGYIIKYGFRNLWKSLFDPGWLNPRYSTIGWSRQGLQFVPGEYGWGVMSSDSVYVQDLYGERAARDLEFHQLLTTPKFLQNTFFEIGQLHKKTFRSYVYISSVILIIGWVFALGFLFRNFFKSSKLSSFFESAFVSNASISIIIASELILYENAMTSWFSQPHFRYFHLTEPWRAIVIGFSISIFLFSLKHFFSKATSFRLKIPKSNVLLPFLLLRNWFVSLQRKHAGVEMLYCSKTASMPYLSFSTAAILLSLWSFSFLSHTTGTVPLTVVSAVAELSDNNQTITEDISEFFTDESCIFHSCSFDLSSPKIKSSIKAFERVIVEFSCKGQSGNKLVVHDTQLNGRFLDTNCY